MQGSVDDGVSRGGINSYVTGGEKNITLANRNKPRVV